MKVSERVIQTLREQGVDTVFGVPGGTIMPLYDALYGAPLKHVLCRHEQGAAFAANGYARASGKTGVCFATSGPGATNLLTGLADAFIDSVPVVAITGQVATDGIGTDAFQEVDILGTSLGVTKHSYLLRHPHEAVETIREAFHIAGSGRPGPVLVDIPKDIQLADAPFAPALHKTENGRSPDHARVAQARKFLGVAKRPVCYVGGGVGLSGATAQLRAFLEQTGMPSVTTLKGIGAVDPRDPLFLGMLGMHGNPAANKAVQRADLLISAGARFDDRVTGRLDAFAPHARVIHLDIDPAEISKRRFPDVGLIGELVHTLPALSRRLRIATWRNACRELKKTHAWTYDRPGDGIYAPLLLRQLSDLKAPNTVICCDVGQHQMWVAQHMSFDGPQTHLSSAGLGAMGFGLPAAIGVQMAHPEACVINVAGDGSFMMNVQELATVKRYGLPLKILVLDNQRLGMVRQWQEIFFEARYSETDLSDNPEFTWLAEAFHIPGACIAQRDAVLPAFTEMLQTPGPYLLHVRINPEENIWPLVPPGASNDEMMEERP